MGKMLQGRKTYLVALAMVAYGLLGVVLGEMELAEAGLFILNGLGMAGIRHGIATA